jgi:hypothetical protein
MGRSVQDLDACRVEQASDDMHVNVAGKWFLGHAGQLLA